MFDYFLLFLYVGDSHTMIWWRESFRFPISPLHFNSHEHWNLLIKYVAVRFSTKTSIGSIACVDVMILAYAANHGQPERYAVVNRKNPE